MPMCRPRRAPPPILARRATAQGWLSTMPIGSAQGLTEKTPVVVAGSGGLEAAQPAVVVSRRTFAGYWEYLLEDAIFTAPPHPAWSGAALLGPDGKLAGIGSLIVGDAVAGSPANMFVPIERLQPVMGDLLALGRPASSPRPWLGSICGSWTASSSSAASPRTGRATEPASGTAIG